MSCDSIKTSSAKVPSGIDGAVEAVALREATVADAPALALLGAATFLEAFTWMLPGADIIAHAAKNHATEAYEIYLRDPATHITLAEVCGGAPVGYAMLTEPELPTLATTPSDIELKRIYLFSRFRNAPVVSSFVDATPIENVRLAQALLDTSIAIARKLGRTRLLLGTHATNVRAIAFYRRNGFVEAGKRTFLVGTQQCCDLIFARPL